MLTVLTESTFLQVALAKRRVLCVATRGGAGEHGPHEGRGWVRQGGRDECRLVARFALLQVCRKCLWILVGQL